MTQKAFTMIFYIVPEDLDDVEQPNAYGIHKNIEDIKPSDVVETFPIQGEYVFRYRYKFQNNIVWMDINNNSPKIPQFNGKIFVKATRVSWNKSNSDQGVNQEVSTTNSQVTKQYTEQRVPFSASNSNSISQISSKRENQQVQKQVLQPQNQQNTPNLLDDYELPKQNNNKIQQQQAGFEQNLFDMNNLGSKAVKTTSKSQHDDLFDF